MAFNFKELKEGDEVVCLYAGLYKNVGAYKKVVHAFRTEDLKEVFHLWGTTMLNHLVYGLPFRSKIKLKYFGMRKEDEMKHPAKIFELVIISSPEVGGDTKIPKEEKDAL